MKPKLKSGHQPTQMFISFTCTTNANPRLNWRREENNLVWLSHMKEISSKERRKIRRFTASSQSIIAYIQLAHFASHKLHHLSAGLSNHSAKKGRRIGTKADRLSAERVVLYYLFPPQEEPADRVTVFHTNSEPPLPTRFH